MEQHFYANGKLMLTGEYLVLDGANTLAFPTKKGQHLTVSPGTGKEIHWRSFEEDGTIWFEDKFSFDEIANPDYVEKADSVRHRLLEILHEAYLKNPDFLDASGFAVETKLTFNRHWGLGTSSTLISTIADWLKIDAFELLWDSFGGSGYDVACGQHNSPLLYHIADQKPVVREVTFKPEFRKHLYFVYLNKKQSSKAAIASYYKNRVDLSGSVISRINTITDAVLSAPDLKTFAYQLEKHESLMSGLLEMHTVKEALFPDFNGVVKSLGSWGGDFVLAVSKEDPTAYFHGKGYDTVVPFEEMVL